MGSRFQKRAAEAVVLNGLFQHIACQNIRLRLLHTILYLKVGLVIQCLTELLQGVYKEQLLKMGIALLRGINTIRITSVGLPLKQSSIVLLLFQL